MSSYERGAKLMELPGKPKKSQKQRKDQYIHSQYWDRISQRKPKISLHQQLESVES
jgi:hypothetical protein